jgi:hypothetical protein
MRRVEEVAVLAGMALVALPLGASAQEVVDTEVRAPVIEEELKIVEEPREELFILNRIPPLQAIDRCVDRFDELCPLKFGAQANFLSNWLNEGFNTAKHGVQIQQTYFTEFTRELFGFTWGAGFEFFQCDTTGGVPGSSMLERDLTIYLPMGWKALSVSPYWSHIRFLDDELDEVETGEIGCEFSLDKVLNPKFLWNYDYDEGKGQYLEWGISHNIPIRFCGEKFAVFTPSIALGMNSRKYIEETVLTHIDWGLDFSLPLNHHFTATGLLHFTKSLNRLKDEDGVRLFENIIPWAGLSLTAEF